MFLKVASTYLPQILIFGVGVLIAQMTQEGWNNRDSLAVSF